MGDFSLVPSDPGVLGGELLLLPSASCSLGGELLASSNTSDASGTSSCRVAGPEANFALLGEPLPSSCSAAFLASSPTPGASGTSGGISVLAKSIAKNSVSWSMLSLKG